MRASWLTSVLARPIVAATVGILVLVGAGVGAAVVGRGHDGHPVQAPAASGGSAASAGTAPLLGAAGTRTPAGDSTTTTPKTSGMASLRKRAAAVAAAAAAAASRSATAAAHASTPLTFVQANIKTTMTDARAQADVDTVYSEHPDFVTFNEVATRPASMLAPAGYQVWHSAGYLPGETAVAWDTRKWTEVDHGTAMVTHKPGRLPWQKVQWGIRYANWVTVVNDTTGQEISVISAHTAPISRITKGLTARGLKRLGALAATLSAHGPVIMGGDFNSAYTTRQYPRAVVAREGFTPTYDILGSHLVTGDHFHATIDYVFLHDASQFVVRDEHADELNSDHNAVVAHLMLLSPGRPRRR